MGISMSLAEALEDEMPASYHDSYSTIPKINALMADPEAERARLNKARDCGLTADEFHLILTMAKWLIEDRPKARAAEALEWELVKIKNGDCDCADFEGRDDLSLHGPSCPRRIAYDALKR